MIDGGERIRPLRLGGTLVQFPPPPLLPKGETTMTMEQFHKERIELESQGYEWAYPRGGHDAFFELKKEHYEPGKMTHIWIQIDMVEVFTNPNKED